MNNKPSFICGHIADYFVIIYPEKEAVGIYKGEKLIVNEKPRGLANFVGKAKDLKLGWAQFENEGDEIVYLYDKADSNFGYALNLDSPQCSEWGYAPFKVQN